MLQEGIRGQTHWNHNHRKLVSLITLGPQLCLTQRNYEQPPRTDESWWRVLTTWSTGEGNGKPLQYSCLENPMNSMKRQKDKTLKDELPNSLGAQYATGDQWRNNSRKNQGMEPKQKEYPAVDVTGDRSKVRCWVFFLLWLHPFILSGVISLLISSSILGTYWPGEFFFQYPIILPFHTVHGVLKARILKWFAIPSPMDHILSDLSTMTRPSWVAPHGMP